MCTNYRIFVLFIGIHPHWHMYYQEWHPQWIQIRVCTVHPGSVVPSLRCWRNVWCCAQPQRTAYCWGRRICFWNTRCVVWRIMWEPKTCWNPLYDRPGWKGNVNAPKNRGFVMWVIAKTIRRTVFRACRCMTLLKKHLLWTTEKRGNSPGFVTLQFEKTR